MEMEYGLPCSHKSLYPGFCRAERMHPYNGSCTLLIIICLGKEPEYAISCKQCRLIHKLKRKLAASVQSLHHCLCMCFHMVKALIPIEILRTSRKIELIAHGFSFTIFTYALSLTHLNCRIGHSKVKEKNQNQDLSSGIFSFM